MLDDGAFNLWKRGRATDWPAFYACYDRWLGFPTTWAVIPDVIDGGSQLQDALLRERPFGYRGAPVWHMDEPLLRLLRLCSDWPRVCIGSTAESRKVMSDLWRHWLDACWNALASEHRHLPWIHMLCGMKCSGQSLPFAPIDSIDIAQNDWRSQSWPRGMTDSGDALQTPGAWEQRPGQMELVAGCYSSVFTSNRRNSMRL